MKGLIYIAMLALLVGCSKTKHFDGPNYYQDGFESYTEYDDLLVNDDSLWSFTQLTKAENTISIDSTFSYAGNKSLKFSDKGSNGDLSKCSIAKQNMAFWDGEWVRMKAMYYLADTAALNWLFLMDIEEQAAISAGPGMRLALVDNQLRVEHKFLESDLTQSAGQEVEFPRDQWVEVVWEILLSHKEEGKVRLYQDGQLIIEADQRNTLPQDILYFQQGTKGMYSSFEIGITANPTDTDLLLWMDDVSIEMIH